MNQKSTLEQALLQVQVLEEAVKKNAKGILAATMRQELNDLLKEAEEEEEKFDASDESDDDVDNPVDGDDETSDDNEFGDDDETPDFGSDETDDDDLGDGDADADDLDNEDLEDDDTLDMTGASDGEVLKVFKAMKPEDGIVVKKQGDNFEFSDGENDYIVKLNESDDSMMGPRSGYAEEKDEYRPRRKHRHEYTESDDFGHENEEENVYEITLDEDDDDSDDDTNESEFKESARTLGNGWRNGLPKMKFKAGRKEIPEGKGSGSGTVKSGSVSSSSTTRTPLKGLKASGGGELKLKVNDLGASTHSGRVPLKGLKATGGNEQLKVNKGGSTDSGRVPLKGLKLNEQVEILKKQNADYKNALVLFKEKLNEVATFNANLAYATRLFTENTTTKQEKLEILKRFDSISTIKESKSLYTQIKSELDNKKPITETVVNKISSEPKTSSSTEMLSEAKAYENPQFKRMKELMGKI